MIPEPIIKGLLWPNEPLPPEESRQPLDFAPLRRLYTRLQHERVSGSSLQLDYALNDHERSALQSMMEDISSILRHYDFKPVVLELSYLKEAQFEQSPNFVSLVLGPVDEDVRRSYGAAMENNLRGRNSRGAILPSPALYHRAFWVMQSEVVPPENTEGPDMVAAESVGPLKELPVELWKPTAYNSQLAAWPSHSIKASDLNTTGEYIRGFHQDLLSNGSNTRLRSCMSDLIVWPLTQTARDGSVQPGGALVAVGRFGADVRDDPNAVRSYASALSRELDHAINDEARYQAQEAEAKRKHQSNWIRFAFGTSHEFKFEGGAYADILGRTKTFLTQQTSDSQELLSELAWIEATTRERSELFDLMQNLVSFMIRQESLEANTTLTQAEKDESINGQRRDLFESREKFDTAGQFARYVLAQQKAIAGLHDASLKAMPPPESVRAAQEAANRLGWWGGYLPINCHLNGKCCVSAPVALRHVTRQLVNNAIVNASQQRPLEVHLKCKPALDRPQAGGEEQKATTARLRVWNDIRVVTRPSRMCPTCREQVDLSIPLRAMSGGYTTTRMDNEAKMHGECPKCFLARVRRRIKDMFDPGYTSLKGMGGSGLGLFIVQFIVETVYSGTIEADITTSDLKPLGTDVSTWSDGLGVCVTVDLPDFMPCAQKT